jgi:hypothetical protein
VTARTKVELLIGALIFANLAVWGARHLAYTLDPIIRALGS